MLTDPVNVQAMSFATIKIVAVATEAIVASFNNFAIWF